MKNKLRLNIAGTLFLILTIFLIVFVSVTVKIDDYETIKKVEITGNRYYSTEEYLNYAHLIDKKFLSHISSSIVRDRLTKHPYINSVDILSNENGVVKAKIIEKDFLFILATGKEDFFITENFEVLPKIKNPWNINVPIVSSVKNADEIKKFEFVKDNEEIEKSFFITETAKASDIKMYQNLSEINLRDGRDALLYFSNLNSVVVLGRQNEINKVVYLSKIWNVLQKDDLQDHLNYVDLRYDKRIYLGFEEGYLGHSGNIL